MLAFAGLLVRPARRRHEYTDSIPGTALGNIYLPSVFRPHVLSRKHQDLAAVDDSDPDHDEEGGDARLRLRKRVTVDKGAKASD